MSRSCISGSILSPREVIQGSVGLPTSGIGHCAEIRVCSHPSLLCFSSVLPPFCQQEQESRSTSKFPLALKQTKFNVIPLKSDFYQMTKESS